MSMRVGFFFVAMMNVLVGTVVSGVIMIMDSCVPVIMAVFVFVSMFVFVRMGMLMSVGHAIMRMLVRMTVGMLVGMEMFVFVLTLHGRLLSLRAVFFS
jgi:hypothetical protein